MNLYLESKMNYTCGTVIALRLTDLNPTCMDLVVVILGYVVPILAVFVIIVNSLIIVVFMKPRMRSHTTFILSLIACVDMLNITCPGALYVYHYSFNNYKDYIRYPFCKLAYFLGDTCVDMLNMISLWLTVMLAYIRSKCLKSPFDAKRIHSGRRITICVTCIFIMALLIHIPSYFLFGFTPVLEYDPVKNETEVICGIKEADVTFHLTICAGRKLHVLIESILNSILPCIILVYYNIVMYLALRESKRCRSSLRQPKSLIQKDKPCITSTSSDPGRPMIQSYNQPDVEAKCARIGDVFSEEANDHVECSHTKMSIKGNSSANNKSRSWYKLCRLNRTGGSRADRASTDTAFEKLDRECMRTSCIILILACMIVLHEIPLSMVNIYMLITHSRVALPLNIYGCMSVVLLLGQYTTYPIIFLIYTCMSGSFRTEIWKSLTCCCLKLDKTASESHKVFLSPCSVRKITRNDDTTIDNSVGSCDDV